MPVRVQTSFQLTLVEKNVLFILNSISFEKPRQSTTARTDWNKRRMFSKVYDPLKSKIDRSGNYY